MCTCAFACPAVQAEEGWRGGGGVGIRLSGQWSNSCWVEESRVLGQGGGTVERGHSQPDAPRDWVPVGICPVRAGTSLHTLNLTFYKNNVCLCLCAFSVLRG